MTSRLQSPVVMVVFNRPDLTRASLAAVMKARPTRILVVADGPREDRPEEGEACREAQAVFDAVRGAVEVEIDASPSNLGIRRRISSGLDWAFDRVPRAIVVEDDCVPDPSFFWLCDALLERFEDDARVGSITGANPYAEYLGPEACRWSYYFSDLGLPWGWATWRDRWQEYDAELEGWSAFRRTRWLQERMGAVAGGQWQRLLDYAHEIDSWWIRWCFTQWSQGRHAAVPTRNLVTNTGMDERATHTHAASAYGKFADLPAHALELPLAHPPGMLRDPESERRTIEGMLPFSGWKRAVKQLAREGHGPLVARGSAALLRRLTGSRD